MARERRKTWREIDSMRDKGGARRDKKNGYSSLERALEDPKLKGLYLKKAEELFMGVKGRPEHSKDLMAIHNSYGTSKFMSRVRHYVDTYGMPDDWGVLLLLLDLKNAPEIVCKAIEALCTLVKKKGPIEQKGLKSKLKVLSITAKDPLIRETAEAQLAGIS